MAPVVGFNVIRDAWGAQDLGVQKMVVHRDVQECAGSVLSGVPSIVDPDWQNVHQTSAFGGVLRVLPAHFTARSRMRRGDCGAFEFTLTFGLRNAGQL